MKEDIRNECYKINQLLKKIIVLRNQIIIACLFNMFVFTCFSKCNAQDQWDWGWNKVSGISPNPYYFQQKIKPSPSDWTIYSKLIWFYKSKVSPRQG